MKSFLLKEKTPICKWGSLPDNSFFQGDVPKGYQLAVTPGIGRIVVDVDVNLSKNKNGFIHIPNFILEELEKSYNYNTKSGGKHYWLNYTGEHILQNKTSGLNIDLRVNNKGYVVYYPNNNILDYLHLINFTSPIMNEWLFKLFL